MTNLLDNNLGRKINKLTAIQLLERRPNGMKLYLWKCDCGFTRKALLGNVTSGNATQCKECAKKQKAKIISSQKSIHGATGTELHSAWLRMISRVDNVYKNITCCDSWRNFIVFKKDMEKNYFSKAALDRIENDKDYSKANCQWLTTSEHNRKTQYDRQKQMKNKL